MAKAKKLPSGSWRCQVYSHSEPVYKDGKPVLDKDGKAKMRRVYESFTADTRRDAEKAAALWAADKKERSPALEITYGEALDNYIKQRSSVLSPSTIREYKRSRRCDLQELTAIKLSDITQDDIQRAINRASLDHSPKTVRNMHGLLSAVMGAYRPDFALKTDLPKKVRAKIYVPSDSEIQAILAYVEGDVMEIPILLSAFGPLRRSEICALKSDHIDGNVIHVEYAMVMDEHHNWVIKRPKSYAGDRYIEFPGFVIEKLKGADGKVTDLNPSQISDRFADVLKRCGVQHFRFHDLRHYSASIQHALGIPDSYIMSRGGWGNDGVLKSVYRHTMESKEREMNRIANSHFEKLCNTKCNTK